MEELLKSLQELLAIESVARRDQEKPFGNGVAQALDYTLSLCQRMGFHTKNADGLYGYAEIGDGAEIIGCLGHLDVVPAGDGWHYPPYAGTIDGGRLYGRGTIDDKGPTLIALFAAHDVAQAYERAGKPMPRRIRFIFGQTEESGPWDDMAAYVAHEEPVRFGFTPDADFPAIYCEKGILRLHLTMPLTGSGILDAKGGTVVNMVPDACTVTTAAGTYQAAGKCAHGSTPWRGENAIDRAMEQLSAESGPFAAAYRALFGSDVYGKKLGIAMTSPDSGPLSMNVGLLRVEDGLIRLSVDIRHPETAAADHIAETVRRAVEPYGFTLAPIHPEKSVYQDKRPRHAKPSGGLSAGDGRPFRAACHRRRDLCKGHGEHYRFLACVSRRGIPGASGGRIYRLGQHREAAPHLCTGVPKPAGIIRIYQA